MKKILLLSAVIITALASCKKDKTENGGGGSTTRILKKITKEENGQSTVYNLEYNSSHNLVSIKSADGIESTTFTYDGQLLTGVEESDDQYRNVYTFSYHNGQPASGNFKSWRKVAGEPDGLDEDDDLSYTLTNNQVSKIHMEGNISGSSIDFLLSYTNGNLTQVTSTGSLVSTTSFSYGSKKPIFPRVTNYVLDQAGYTLQFFAKNEMLSASYDFPGSNFDFSTNTQYTYTADGYVLTSFDGDTKLKFEYQ